MKCNHYWEHFCTCIKHERSFLNRMLSVLRDNYNNTVILLPSIFHQDLNWFIKVLPSFNGKAFVDHTPVAGEIQLDACAWCLGACFINQVYTIQIPLGYKDFNISHLEMLNILVRVWGPAWQGKKLLVHCNNQAVVTILNSGATRDLTMAAQPPRARIKAKMGYIIYYLSFSHWHIIQEFLLHIIHML